MPPSATMPSAKRPVIMAAMRVDRENLRARSHQQHFLVADMAEQGLALEIGRRADALRQIGPGGRRLLFSHVHSRFVAATIEPS